MLCRNRYSSYTASSRATSTGPAEAALGLARAPTRRRARRRSARARAGGRPPGGRARRPPPGVRCPRTPVRSGRGSVASISSSEVSRANSVSSSLGAQSALKVSRAAPSRSSTALVGRKCGTGPEGDLERAERERLVRLVLRERERALDVLRPHAGARADLPEGLGGARRGDQPRPRGRVGAGVPADRHGLLARRVDQRGRVRDEVEDVVGVQVRDHDRVDLPVLAVAAQLAEHAAAAVEQHAGAVRLDEVAAARPSRVLPRR